MSDLTPETLRSIIRQIADGIEDPEVAIALLEVGDKHASVWEANRDRGIQLEQEFAIDHAQMQARIEALEKGRDADWRKFVHLRDDNERIRVLGEELAQKESRIEALENEAATLHAALMVFEAGWSTGGYLDPLDFWDKCFPRLNDLVPPDHRSFVWAVEQEMRDRAPLRGEEEK